ncbi:hypothetical protein [Leptothoe spongobia]|uniref:Uncharacterized protein n=1 Tax=Leptothoe spongobia TAU-MAC 1115 TaxID=1967444 RepID=A0A947GMU2_9CYAN|nr:hypothetical protein [Leptothoe spongobia]MBT9317877.1 hypothetical protein [Leptothoe spongobia TAU-MAC 1115]
MPFSVRYNAELQAIETSFSGLITEDDIQAQMLVSCQTAAEHKTSSAIVNVTDATLRISITFIYNLPELCETMGAKRPIRLALINLNEQNSDLIGFYQLVSQNRGWNVEIFSDVEQAKTWLMS